MIFFLFLACTEKKQLLPASDFLKSEAAIFTGVSMDYATGSLSAIETDSLELFENLSSVSGDPAIRYKAGYLWQLNRYQYDTIRKYDPTLLQSPLLEISVAPETGSSNPHDIEICEDQLFVSLYEQPELLILDPETMNEVARIDIVEFADEDQRTEASSLVKLGGSLYLGLQGLDRNDGFSYQQSRILEIDCSSHEISNVWSFGANIQLHDWTDEQFLISSHQSTDSSAGLYAFQAETEIFSEILLTETNISAVAAAGEQLAFISYPSVGGSYQVHCFDGESWYSQLDFIEYLTDIQFNQEGEIWVTAHWGWINPNQAKAGIYRFNSRCEELHPGFIDTYLAPNSLVFVTP